MRFFDGLGLMGFVALWLTVLDVIHHGRDRGQASVLSLRPMTKQEPSQSKGGHPAFSRILKHLKVQVIAGGRTNLMR